MLSKKMAFSLMSLITLIALAFAVPSAMAAAFEIKIAGRASANYAVEGGAVDYDEDVEVLLKVSSGQPIADLMFTPGEPVKDNTDTISVVAFDKNGFAVPLTGTNVTIVDLPIVEPTANAADNPGDVFYAMKTPKEHQLLVTITSASDAD